VNELCEFLPWDSEFFGIRIGRVRGCRLTAASAFEVCQWAAAHHIDCLYFLADAADPATLQLAPRYGFDLVDLRVTLSCTATASPRDRPAATVVRPAAAEDVDALRRIARGSHRDSRFYADGRFDERRSDDLFATWIEKSCDGYADIVLVAEADGQPAGYITGRVDGDNRGTIGLVGIDSARRRRGCGRALVGAVLAWFAARDVALVSVVTQGRNAEALSFYQANGFDVVRIEPWYHRWSAAAGRA
jgi:dTDP-4-amino-4,6-dideoxy-D-galactose acyltransferase